MCVRFRLNERANLFRFRLRARRSLVALQNELLAAARRSLLALEKVGELGARFSQRSLARSLALALAQRQRL